MSIIFVYIMITQLLQPCVGIQRTKGDIILLIYIKMKKVILFKSIFLLYQFIKKFWPG